MVPSLVLDACPAVGPHGQRGIGRYVRGLLAVLPSADVVRPWVLASEVTTGAALRGRRMILPALAWRTSEAGWLTRWAGMELAIRRADAVAMHATDPWCPLLPKRVRVAVTMYDLIPLLDPDGFSTWHPYHRAIYHWYLRTARGADLLVVISRTTAHWAVEHLGVDPAHIAVVPPLVEHPVSLARVPEPEPTFVWVGALDRHKRPELAVLALAAFRLRHGGGLLRFIGPADPARMRVIQETARRAGVGDAVILEGHLPAVELEAAFSSAAALLTTSRMEGFGLPAVEAAMRGVPVVAVDIPAAREALGDTATFTQADPSRIADALEAVRPASPASRKRLVERYARPAVANALSSAYLRLLGPTA